jgi:excisionase family DNA binding protein
VRVIKASNWATTEKSGEEKYDMKNDNMMPKRFYRPDEVAELLLITKRTIYRMVHDGRLNGVDLSQRPWRIPRAAILSLFDPKPVP